ncbi:MAG: hypothetical protein JJ850_16090 [Kordiimonadaceae bacterium]|nr:hypothetical protein [Kordiimonadaceae bacterium]MBO6569608.1 hypothetical protein [Kordiimonadaceae bacterium]MBO6966143.1 hypothetical protein [Kordiimonadaceae bacterium]
MSFIEEHAGALPRASALAAIGEAFGFLKEGGVFSVRLVFYCGTVLLIFGLAQDYFGAKGIWFSILQIMAESVFIYSWHRFALLGEQQIGGDHWNAFAKRTLFYYFVLVLVVIVALVISFVGISQMTDSVAGILMAIVLVACLLFVPRIALVFPAIAVNSAENKMRDAFVLSSGNVLALAGAYVVMTIIVLVLFAPVSFVFYSQEAQVSAVNDSPIYVLIVNAQLGYSVAVSTLLWAGLNSSLFKQLGGMDNLENSEPTERADGDQA